jgi:hypothetical protein
LAIAVVILRLNACARALRDAGATHVAVLTLARVTREDFN